MNDSAGVFGINTTSNQTIDNVLPWLAVRAGEGQRTCLATLVYADGSSPRPCGAQMAIAEDGTFYGYLTGGCAETAIAEEGQRAINAGENSAVRFGIGSPYLDIQLPCGAGIDIWFDQTVSLALVDNAVERLRARQPVCVGTEVSPLAKSARIVAGAGAAPGEFMRWYYPTRRLYIVGAGPAVPALAKLAVAADYDTHVLSPDPLTLTAIDNEACSAETFTDISQIHALARDNHSAVVLLFHEHERETQLLKSFLDSDVYYIGALGSPRTQKIRLDLLLDAGVHPDSLQRIHGPVGLDIQAATPAEIAVAILAEMTIVFRAARHPLLEWSGGSLT